NDKFKPPQARGETAKAVSSNVVYAQVPYAYHLNPERYLRVARLIPLRENLEMRGRYRKRLEEMLQDPATTVRAALRLEGLGRESIAALQKGLQSQSPLVRFSAAEALAYLGSTSGGEELARLAAQYDALRVYCLTALASLDESVSHVKLTELLASTEPEL